MVSKCVAIAVYMAGNLWNNPATMQDDASKTIQSKAYGLPQILQNIPDPPTGLHVRSSNWENLLRLPAVAIVGSRKPSAYGQMVTEQLASELGRAGIVIVSGLALGIDAIAHRAALEAGGLTIAVLAHGLDTVYPATNRRLAEKILRQGGALASEYPVGSPPYPMNFVARNRLISGLAGITIITEAASKSGSLHTAAFALEQGREVAAVPGMITSPLSAGCHQLLKRGSAMLVTCAGDVLDLLGLSRASPITPKGDTPAQQCLLDLLATGVQDGAQLVAQSQLPISEYNQAVTMLEVNGAIRPLGNNQWTICSAG